MLLEVQESDAKSLQEYNNSGFEEEQQKQKYPAIQLNDYRSLKPNSELWWCFSEPSVRLMPEAFQIALKLEEVQCYYDEKPSTMFKPTAELRFIPLALPKIFKYNKETKEYSRLSKFTKDDRTVAKLFLAVMADGKLLSQSEIIGTDEDDKDAEVNKLLIITLKLNSFKTDEIIGRDSTQEGTLKALSYEISKHKLGSAGRSNLHFVNFQINPSVKLYKGKNASGKEESSYSATYALASAKLNTPEDMKLLTGVFANEELMQAILDPFGIDQKQVENPAGEVSDQDSRNVLREDVKEFARLLEWSNARISQEIKESFGVDRFADLSVEQMVGFCTHLKGLVELDKSQSKAVNKKPKSQPQASGESEIEDIPF